MGVDVGGSAVGELDSGEAVAEVGGGGVLVGYFGVSGFVEEAVGAVEFETGEVGGERR